MIGHSNLKLKHIMLKGKANLPQREDNMNYYLEIIFLRRYLQLYRSSNRLPQKVKVCPFITRPRSIILCGPHNIMWPQNILLPQNIFLA